MGRGTNDTFTATEEEPSSFESKHVKAFVRLTLHGIGNHPMKFKGREWTVITSRTSIRPCQVLILVNRAGRPCKVHFNRDSLWCTDTVNSKLQVPTGFRPIAWQISGVKQSLRVERLDPEIRRKHPIQEVFGEMGTQLHLTTVRFWYLGQDTSCNAMCSFRDRTPAARFLFEDVE